MMWPIRSILALTVLFAAALASAAPKNPHAIAVIIGNKDYKHERVPDVAYAHRDAEAMKRYVIDVLGYDAKNVFDLRDADQADIASYFGKEGNHKGLLWRYIDPRGRSDVLVFYSGHGVPGQNDKRGYLLPVNANPNTAEINGFPVDVLYANLAKLKTRSMTVLLDACFSGDSHQGMLIRSASPVYVKAAMPTAPKNMTVLTAAGAGQLASWDEERKHGLFTDRFLAGAYGTADADRDGNVTLAEMREHLFNTMTADARRSYGRIQEATTIGADSTVLAALPGGKALIRPKLEAGPGASGEETKTAAVAPPPKPALDLVPVEAAFITTRNANVRAEPSINAAKVATLPTGTEVYVPGQTKDGDWLRVERDGKALGYVYKTLLEDKASIEDARRKSEEQKKLTAGRDRITARQLAAIETRLDAAREDLRNQRKLYASKFTSQQAVLERESAVAPLEVEKSKLQLAALQPSPKPSGAAKPKPTVGLRFAPGDTFKDCAGCPEMVVIPPGSFMMGSPSSEAQRASDEGPQHRVAISLSFAVGKYEVTQVEWRSLMGNNPSRFKGESRPVEQVSWNDAQEFIQSLSRKTGQTYRLLSEAEWEYAARAGTTTRFAFGDALSSNEARFSSDGTVPVGRYRANRFGLYDMHGNVWEWVLDCYKSSYSGAPTDGSAVGNQHDTCSRVRRGGSWGNGPGGLRSAFRGRYSASLRVSVVGFRVARTLNP